MRSIGCMAAAVAMAGNTCFAYLTEFGGTPVNVEYSTGTGENAAIMVADFGGGASYAFGYRWDGQTTVTSIALLQSVDTAGGFDVQFADYGWGIFVDSMSYNGHTMKGWVNETDWMAFFISSDGQTWSSPSYGASSRELANGSWDGWAHQATEAVPPDYIPQTAPNTPVPEPGTWTLCAVGGALLAWRRRRSAR